MPGYDGHGQWCSNDSSHFDEQVFLQNFFFLQIPIELLLKGPFIKGYYLLLFTIADALAFFIIEIFIYNNLIFYR